MLKKGSKDQKTNNLDKKLNILEHAKTNSRARKYKNCKIKLVARVKEARDSFFFDVGWKF